MDSLKFPIMQTYAVEFLNRFPQVCDSGLKVSIASFNMGGIYKTDKTANDIMAAMRAAYHELYGDEGKLEFESIQEPSPPRNIFDRMFPTNHLHVAVSSRGLQMLSKVPERVVENGWNKGKVWIEGSNPRVGRAYAEQADSDLVAFLKSRRDELKVGGSLFMLIEGRPSWSESQLGDDSDMNRKHPLNIYMERAWENLVDKKFINEEERNGFNIPIYFRSQEEVKMSIKRCGGFKIEMIVNLKIADQMNETPTMWVDYPDLYGKQRAQMARDAIEDFTKEYFGEDNTDKLFAEYASIAENDTELLNKACFTEVIAVSATRI